MHRYSFSIMYWFRWSSIRKAYEERTWSSISYTGKILNNVRQISGILRITESLSFDSSTVNTFSCKENNKSLTPYSTVKFQVFTIILKFYNVNVTLNLLCSEFFTSSNTKTTFRLIRIWSIASSNLSFTSPGFGSMLHRNNTICYVYFFTLKHVVYLQVCVKMFWGISSKLK